MLLLQNKADLERVGIRVLRAVQDLIDPNAIIAGGWARDILLPEGGVPKDIDVWVYNESDLESLMDTLMTIGYVRSVLRAEPGTVAATYCRALIKMNIAGVDVDVIFFVEPVTFRGVVERFDMGIGQAAFDGTNFFSTEQFKKDTRDKVIRPTAAAFEREDLGRIVHERLPRMRQKFPLYTVSPDWPTVAKPAESAAAVGFTAVYGEKAR